MYEFYYTPGATKTIHLPPACKKEKNQDKSSKDKQKPTGSERLQNGKGKDPRKPSLTSKFPKQKWIFSSISKGS